jgi:hypothetical protein
MVHKDLEKFQIFFGTWPNICAELWRRIDPVRNINSKSLTMHLLWALLLMCQYSQEVISGALVGVHQETYCKYAMPIIKAISSLTYDIIDFSNRFVGNWHYWTFSVDGIHCRIYEGRDPFWKGLYSHKFEGPAYSYQVATAVTTGHIIAVHGPYPAGKWPDYKIFKETLANQIIEGKEMGVADAGYAYRGLKRWLYPAYWRTKRGEKEGVSMNILHENIRARHEQTNCRFAKFNCISSIFRHPKQLHHYFFNAVACVVQLEIMAGLLPIFDVIPSPEYPLDHPRNNRLGGTYS